MTVSGIDAVLLSGGSLFGLDAGGGAVSFLRQQGRGTPIRAVKIPIAVQATTFDLLNGGDKDWAACPPTGSWAGRRLRLRLPPPSPRHGRRRLWRHHRHAQGGLGSASATMASGFAVGAIVIVNAVGSPVIGAGPHFWAAPCEVGTDSAAWASPHVCRRKR
jgi:L-aminopeptidase/D-esterase-like protein